MPCHWTLCSPGRIGLYVPTYVDAPVLVLSLELGMFSTFVEPASTNDQLVSLGRGHSSWGDLLLLLARDW